MTLSELLTEVYGITKRPDLVTTTTSAIKNAIVKMHTKDFYSKDIVETGVAFASSLTLQTLAYKTLFPLWRAVSYIQPLSSTSPFDPVGLQLDQINPQFGIDDYWVFKDNVYYEAGLNLKIRTNPAAQYFNIGYYAFPNIGSTADYFTWITQDFPYSVVFDAAAMIFKSIGFAEQEASMRTLVGEQMKLIDISNIQATGY